MGYSYLYLISILILFMVVLRFFIPLLVYLIPIFVIVYLIRRYLVKKKEPQKEEYDYYETNSSSYNNQSDVIDVDFKVVDVEESTH